MALPDYIKSEQGTAKVWATSGGDYALSLASVANNAARQGAKGDLGSTFARRWYVEFSAAVNVAASTGTEIELFWAASPSATAGTSNPGNCDGTDSALATPDELKPQLIFLGSLTLSNTRGTNIQRAGFVFAPPTRYGMPVVVNKSGQALNSSGTGQEVKFVPIEESINE